MTFLQLTRLNVKTIELPKITAFTFSLNKQPDNEVFIPFPATQYYKQSMTDASHIWIKTNT